MNDLKITYLPIGSLTPASYNARKWNEKNLADLEKSLKKHGIVDPAVINSAPNRKNVIIGGHMRIHVAKKMGIKEFPCVFVNIPDIEKEKSLNLALNKVQGEWDLDLLKVFDENLLSDIGFDSEELDEIFGIENTPENWSLENELKKLDIQKITVQKGDIYAIDNKFKLLCGDSTVEADVLKIMGEEKADFTLTDPPYILSYLKGGIRHGKPTVGFGSKRNRRYLETDVLPPDFTEKWMKNVNKVQNESCNIMVFENWKNLRTIWNEMEKYWKVKNLIIWHTPNRNQGFSGKHHFFSKYDIALAGSSSNKDVEFNLEPEEDGLQNDYEAALFGISGDPHWESYGKNKPICPTDFIKYNVADEKSSGQGIVFGVKPLEILIPYIKVLTRRNDLIFEPFGGSGSTAAAALKMKRRCYLVEKSPVYAQVILHRIEKLTGAKPIKIN